MEVKTEAPVNAGPPKPEISNQQQQNQPKGPSKFQNHNQNQNAGPNNRGNFMQKKGKNFPMKGKVGGPGMNNRGPMKNEVSRKKLFVQRARSIRHFSFV
jgi:hypothetical protein